MPYRRPGHMRISFAEFGPRYIGIAIIESFSHSVDKKQTIRHISLLLSHVAFTGIRQFNPDCVKTSEFSIAYKFNGATKMHLHPLW